MIKFVSKFLLNFSFIRFLRSFFYTKISPWLKYFYYAVFIFAAAYTPFLVNQNSDQIASLKRKIFTKYIEIIDHENDFYSKVKIVGNVETDYELIATIVREEVKNFSKSDDRYMESIIKNIKGKIEELEWIKNVIIFRNLPSDLIIKIEEYEPFAIWEGGKSKYIIDKNGKIVIKVKSTSDYEDLLILSGEKANLNANTLFNVLVNNLEISKDIYSATWIGSRRWDIRFDNDLLVKLPEINIEKAWKSLVKIYNTPGSLIDLKAIDLRIKDKVYLEYNNNSIKSLRSL